MCLNGQDLVLGENDTLPELKGVPVSGEVQLPAYACAFYVI